MDAASGPPGVVSAPASGRMVHSPVGPRTAEGAVIGLRTMKFGGSSVADAEKIKIVARRIAAARESGDDVVAVVSARGKTTDGLVAMAQEISDRPDPRELDMLLSTGERISCALMAMALHDLGHEASSFTGSQAGIVTDGSHTKAKIIEVRATRLREALDDGHIVLVAGFQGVSDGAQRHHARPGRLRHHRRRAGRRPRGGRVRDLHRRDRRVHRRPARGARRPQAPSAEPRGDAGDGGVRLQGARATVGGVRPPPRRAAARALLLPSGGGDLDHEGDTRHGEGDRHGPRPPQRRGEGHRGGPGEPPRRGRPHLHRPGRPERERRHDHPEPGERSARRRRHLHRAARRAPHGDGGPRGAARRRWASASSRATTRSARSPWSGRA